MQEPLVTDEVVAKSFRLVNDKGETMARLGADRNGLVEFVLYDVYGKERLSASIWGLSFRGPDENIHARLALFDRPMEGVVLEMSDRESKISIQTRDFHYEPSVELIGERGKIRLGRGYDGDHGHGLFIANSDGELGINVVNDLLRTKPQERPHILLYDHSGGRYKGKSWVL